MLLSAVIALAITACAINVIPSPLSEYRSMAQMVPSSFTTYDRTAPYYLDPDRDWRGRYR